MNEQIARDLLERVTNQEAPPGFSLKDVITRGERARRRRQTGRLLTGAAVMGVVIAGAVMIPNMVAKPVNTHVADQSAVHARPVLHVTCTEDATILDATTVAASPDGVHVAARDTSAANDTVLSYATETPSSPTAIPGANGGSEWINAQSQDIVWTPPPGPLQLQCIHGHTRTPPAQVTITDSTHFYLAATLADFGCPTVGLPGSLATAITAGRDAPDAVRKLTDSIMPGGSLLTVEPIRSGYENARQQLFAIKDGQGARDIAITQPTPGGSTADIYRTCANHDVG